MNLAIKVCLVAFLILGGLSRWLYVLSDKPGDSLDTTGAFFLLVLLGLIVDGVLLFILLLYKAFS